MKTILLSSKFDLDKHNYLSNVVDANLVNYLRKNNNNILVIPNYKLSQSTLKHLKVNSIILTGGGNIFSKNKNEKNRFKLENELIKFALSKKIPLLGICRGMQAICNFFKIKISKVKNHVNKKHKIILKNKTIIRNSFHNYGIMDKDFDQRFEVLGIAKDNTVELINLKKTKIYGMMWHPERQKYSKFKYDLSLVNFNG